MIVDYLAQFFVGELIVAGVNFTQECFCVHSCVKFFVYGHVFAAEFREFVKTVATAALFLQGTSAVFQIHDITLVLSQIAAACPMQADYTRFFQIPYADITLRDFAFRVFCYCN